MLFTDVKSIAIPEGDVQRIYDGNGTMIWEKNNGETYTYLQYISTNGNQYLDTGYLAGGNNISIEVEASISAVSVQNWYVCWSTNFSMRFSRGFGSRYQAYCKFMCSSYGNAGSQKTLPMSTSTFLLDSGRFLINGSTVAQARSGSYGTDDSIKIFDEGMTGNIYYVVITDNSMGETVRNLSPAIRDSDGAIGMYDDINDIFYVSAGSSDFIAGPPV